MNLDEIDADIRGRLAEIARDYSQAEIARRTGSTRNNVSRYVRGRRAPVEFAGALVKGLGVNPSWLLTGEGARYLADMAVDTSGMAADLLDMIKAMTAVAQMRLGALAGKHHLGVLRKLNQAMKEYEQVQSRLNNSLKPVVSDLLDEYQNTLLRNARARAEELRSALTQMSRLCDDPRLAMRFMHLQGAHEVMIGRPESAIEFERQVFAYRITSAREVLTDEACNHVRNLMTMLDTLHRDREAAAIGRAVLALAEAADVSAEWVRLIECQVANAEINYGDMRRGLPRFVAAYANLSPERRRMHEHALGYNLYCAGTLDAYDVLRLNTGAAHNGRLAMYVAIWSEDADVIEEAIQGFVGSKDFLIDPDSSLARHAKRMLRALRGETPGGESLPEDGFSKHADILDTQWQRLLGNRRLALQNLHRAFDRLEKKSPELSPHTVFYGVHCRNAIELLNPNSRNQRDVARRNKALEWVGRQLQQGYGFLNPLRKHIGVNVGDEGAIVWAK